VSGLIFNDNGENNVVNEIGIGGNENGCDRNESDGNEIEIETAPNILIQLMQKLCCLNIININVVD
jgi:hypothetical protein